MILCRNLKNKTKTKNQYFCVCVFFFNWKRGELEPYGLDLLCLCRHLKKKETNQYFCFWIGKEMNWNHIAMIFSLCSIFALDMQTDSP